jgi:hypothetical protein
MSMANVCTYNPVATDHNTKYHDMSPQFKKSVFLKKYLCIPCADGVARRREDVLQILLPVPGGAV